MSVQRDYAFDAWSGTAIRLDQCNYTVVNNIHVNITGYGTFGISQSPFPGDAAIISLIGSSWCKLTNIELVDLAGEYSRGFAFRDEGNNCTGNSVIGATVNVNRSPFRIDGTGGNGGVTNLLLQNIIELKYI